MSYDDCLLSVQPGADRCFRLALRNAGPNDVPACRPPQVMQVDSERSPARSSRGCQIDPMLNSDPQGTTFPFGRAKVSAWSHLVHEAGSLEQEPGATGQPSRE